MNEVTLQRALEYYHYEPETGVVMYSKTKPRDPHKRGRQPIVKGVIPNLQTFGQYTGVNGSRYQRIQSAYITEGRSIMIHRLIMSMVIGRPLEPNELVDHINGIRDDNRVCNLRIVSMMDNVHNKTRIHPLNTSGYMWVQNLDGEYSIVQRITEKMHGKTVSFYSMSTNLSARDTFLLACARHMSIIGEINTYMRGELTDSEIEILERIEYRKLRVKTIKELIGPEEYKKFRVSKAKERLIPRYDKKDADD